MDSESMSSKIEQIKKVIKVYPDFPKKGVDFVDYFSILKHPAESQMLTDATIEKIDLFFEGKEFPNVIVGLESRGFFLGMLLAQHYKIPFVPIRKKGKLPGECVGTSYEKEYGTDSVECQKDSLSAESKVLIIDDLLATGGTMIGSIELIEKCGASLFGAYVIFELTFLSGKEKMKDGSKLITLMEY